MDQTLINFFFLASSGIIGWFCREIWTAVKELKEDLSHLREEIAKDYVSKEDYKEDIREIKELVRKLFDAVNQKVDR